MGKWFYITVDLTVTSSETALERAVLCLYFGLAIFLSHCNSECNVPVSKLANVKECEAKFYSVKS